ncbi:MAG TPA: hypothetical protein VF893_04655 [Candidatus Bathyarchaeia archaeon]
MRDKNEGIYLWLLEQDRQKSRVLPRGSELSGAVEEQPRISADCLSGKVPSNESKYQKSTSSETAGFEQLLAEIAALEEESRRLDEVQQQQRSNLKILSEKLIREKRKRNIDLQAAIGKLETQLTNLISSTQVEIDAGEVNGKLEKAALEPSHEASSDSGRDGNPVDIVEEIE